MDPVATLRAHFGYPAFRPGQQELVRAVLSGRDALGILPTGGGKTEAYLGLACCAMLYDRLRNKRFGMTAWLRFALRMLSIQQLQRAMRVIWETEEERKRILGEEASQSAPLRLGYFVGSTTTPNSLSVEFLSNLTTDDSLERVRAVPDCPACGGRGTVKTHADIQGIRFRHVCNECKAELPLDVSDDEVYRHLPALIVGTIDKMATVGQQPKFGLLWGGAKWKCPEHGYGFGEYCSAFGCKVDKKLRRTVKPYDPAPSLHIQDELHLLQEELGAFSGHYETLIRSRIGPSAPLPISYVAATVEADRDVGEVAGTIVKLGPGATPEEAVALYAAMGLEAVADPGGQAWFLCVSKRPYGVGQVYNEFMASSTIAQCFVDYSYNAGLPSCPNLYSYEVWWTPAYGGWTGPHRIRGPYC